MKRVYRLLLLYLLSASALLPASACPAASTPPGQSVKTSAPPAQSGHADSEPEQQGGWTPAQTVATASELQRQIELLKLKAQIAKLEKEIREADKPVQTKRVEPDASLSGSYFSPGFTGGAIRNGSGGKSLPQILNIVGHPGHLVATLVMAGGGTITVSGPGAVSDDVRILAISDQGVGAVVNGKTVQLPFYRKQKPSRGFFQMSGRRR